MDEPRVPDEQLVALAAGALRPVEASPGRWLADVGAAVEAADGSIHLGSCVGGHLGVCAEQVAIGVMVRHTGAVVRRMVAVWREPGTGQLHVLPPCGRCREFVAGLDEQNLDTVVLLGPGHRAPLRSLLPLHFWHAEPVDG